MNQQEGGIVRNGVRGVNYGDTEERGGSLFKRRGRLETCHSWEGGSMGEAVATGLFRTGGKVFLNIH